MRDQSNSRATWSALGWLAPVAFLAIPGCELVFPLHQPPPPQDWAVFCDIEDRNQPRRCATDEDLQTGIPIGGAAIALTTRRTSSIGLDHSPAAIQQLGCAPGRPVAVTFVGPFPKGTAKCLTDAPAAIGPTGVWSNVQQVCYSKCYELFRTDEFDDTLDDFCNQSARPSTNFPPVADDDDDDLLAPFHQACTRGGMEGPAYDTATNPDPRRLAEPAPWRYVSSGVLVDGTHHNSLTRVVPFAGQWDQGAATLHLISEGDGYVEFTATQTDTDRACGLSSGILPDTDPGLDDIDFAVRLAPASGLIIQEGGTPVTPFMPYALGDRVRIAFTDNFDGTADIAYHLIPATCPGPACEGSVLRNGGPAAYPLHVDAALLTQPAHLGDVRIVRVKKSLF